MAGERIPSEILNKYDAIAREILENTFKISYDELKEKLNENRQNFLDELEKL